MNEQTQQRQENGAPQQVVPAPSRKHPRSPGVASSSHVVPSAAADQADLTAAGPSAPATGSHDEVTNHKRPRRWGWTDQQHGEHTHGTNLPMSYEEPALVGQIGDLRASPTPISHEAHALPSHYYGDTSPVPDEDDHAMEFHHHDLYDPNTHQQLNGAYNSYSAGAAAASASAATSTTAASKSTVPRPRKTKKPLEYVPVNFRLPIFITDRVKSACQSCKTSKTKCDTNRPCARCVRLGNEDTCREASTEGRTPTSQEQLCSQPGSQPSRQQSLRSEEAFEHLQPLVPDVSARPRQHSTMLPLQPMDYQTKLLHSHSAAFPPPPSSSFSASNSNPPLPRHLHPHSHMDLPFMSPSASSITAMSFLPPAGYHHSSASGSSHSHSLQSPAASAPSAAGSSSTGGATPASSSILAASPSHPVMHPAVDFSVSAATALSKRAQSWLNTFLRAFLKHISMWNARFVSLHSHAAVSSLQRVELQMKRSKALVDLVMQMVARLDQPSSVNQTATPASAATTVKDEFGMEQETQPSSASAAASSSGDSSSTDLYSTLNIGALTFTFTNGMHSLTCNHALPKLLGYPSPAAFLELTDSVEGISYLYPESNLPRIIPAYVDAILDGRYDFAAQTEWRARDGIRRRALQSVTIMYDAEGLPWKSTALVCALADAQMLPVDARVALMPSAMPSLSTGGMTSPREGNCVYGYNASAQQQQLLSPPPPQVSFTSSYTATPSSSTLTTTSSSMSVYQPNYYVSASPPSLPPPSSVSASYTPLSMYLPPPQSQMPFGYQQPSNPMFQTHAPSHPQARPPSQKSTSPPSTIGESQKFYTKLRR